MKNIAIIAGVAFGVIVLDNMLGLSKMIAKPKAAV